VRHGDRGDRNSGLQASPHQSLLAARLSATIVFIDESGMLMAPLVRRSWSLRGHTPVLRQRGQHYQKVSAIAALCIPPTRDRLALYFRLHAAANVNTERALDFLQHLQRQLTTPIVLVWDSFQAHKGELIKQCVLPGSAHLEYLPPYAPELNPVEYLWSWLKTNPLANDPIVDLNILAYRTRSAARSVQRRQDLLQGFIRHTGLPLRLH
jgi:transposase